MEWALLIFLAVATAFISAAETALFAVRRIDLLRWKEEGSGRTALIARLLDKPDKLITTIFIVNELTNVTISALIASMLIPVFPRYGEAIALAAGTFVILILGDLIPKCMAWSKATSISLFAAPTVHFLSRVLAPVRYLVERIAGGIVFLMSGGRIPDIPPGLSEREFRAMVDASEEAGALDPGEKKLIHNIFEMTEQRAGEVMTPLVDVLMVPVGLSYEDLLQEIRRYRRSRIPVFDGSRQNVVGILYTKELLRPMAEGRMDVAWRELLAPPFVVPASKKLPLLLRDFQQRKIHIALVVDEFGEIVGIITLEDVLEELFGEIMEEHDREEKEIAELPDGSYRVLGKLPVYRFNETFGTDLPDREWDTIAGLLLHEFGRLPARGDAIMLGNLRFAVERVKGIRIVEVVVRPSGPRADGGKGE